LYDVEVYFMKSRDYITKTSSQDPPATVPLEIQYGGGPISGMIPLKACESLPKTPASSTASSDDDGDDGNVGIIIVIVILALCILVGGVFVCKNPEKIKKLMNKSAENNSDDK
jgi:hypothetical protein